MGPAKDKHGVRESFAKVKFIFAKNGRSGIKEFWSTTPCTCEWCQIQILRWLHTWTRSSNTLKAISTSSPRRRVSAEPGSQHDTLAMRSDQQVTSRLHSAMCAAGADWCDALGKFELRHQERRRRGWRRSRFRTAHGDPRGENDDRPVYGLSMVFPMLSVYICIMFREIWDFKPCLLQVMRQRFATQPFGMFPSSTSYWSSYGSSYWGSPIWIDGWNLGMVDPTALLTLACWCLLCQVAAPVTGPPKLTFPIPGSMEGVKPLPENPTPRTSQVHGV